MHDRAPTVVFSGGGTGGHLYPALALAEALVRLRPDVRPFFIGASRGVEARILPERGLEYALLPVEGFARGEGVRALRALPRLAASLFRVVGLFRRLRPEAVVVTGGYAAAPAGIVARLTGVPLVVQEQNAVPGVTTRLLARWASVVHVAFPEAVPRLPRRARQRARVSGNPVRVESGLSRDAARDALGLPRRARVVLVVGGSQGSVALNRVMLEACSEARSGRSGLPGDLHLLWSTGPRHHESVSRGLSELGDPDWVTAVPYLDDMPAALVASDLAVSRAGAMATAELLVNGLPAVLVPLPTAAADHQAHNATALEEAGVAVVLPEPGLTGGRLLDEVVGLLEDPERMAAMSERARARSVRGAASVIARDIAALLPGGAP